MMPPEPALMSSSDKWAACKAIGPNTRSRGEALAMLVAWATAAAVVGILGWILLEILLRGVPQLSIAMLVESPRNAGRAGGISTIIVSTALVLGVSLAAAVPVSLAVAIALSETIRRGSHYSIGVRYSLGLLAAVPSIVFGLFGNAFFCITLGLGYSILSGGLTVACMVIPILTLTWEQTLRSVPDAYRYAAASLGMSRTSTLTRIVLPTAARGMAAGLVLSVGRVLAETAALIFTAGYVTRMPESLRDSGRTLSVHIYDLAMNVPGGNDRAYATAAVLVVILLVSNSITTLLTRLAGAQTVSSTAMVR